MDEFKRGKQRNGAPFSRRSSWEQFLLNDTVKIRGRSRAGVYCVWLQTVSSPADQMIGLTPHLWESGTTGLTFLKPPQRYLTATHKHTYTDNLSLTCVGLALFLCGSEIIWHLKTWKAGHTGSRCTNPEHQWWWCMCV